MKKALSIQDFALYLGAPCECKSAERHELGFIDSVFLKGQTIASAGYGWHVSEVKPILCRLDSLMEAEARGLYEMVNGRPYPSTNRIDCLTQWWRNYEEGADFPTNIEVIGNPNAWRWLLAYHFDLFGWIESGLALESDQTIAP